MKIVRKLLRLLPFIYLIGGIIFYILKYQQVGGDNNNYISLLETLMNSNNIFALPNIFSRLYTWFSQNIFVTSSYYSQYIFAFVYRILAYEVICSLMFVVFDVFNFILTIASNWLRKGEKLNE